MKIIPKINISPGSGGRVMGSRAMVETIASEIGRTRRERRALRAQLQAMFWDDLSAERAKGKPLCGAQTRTGQPCRRKGSGKGNRCPNHGGRSTGPRTAEGKARVAAAQRMRWQVRKF